MKWGLGALEAGLSGVHSLRSYVLRASQSPRLKDKKVLISEQQLKHSLVDLGHRVGLKKQTAYAGLEAASVITQN